MCFEFRNSQLIVIVRDFVKCKLIYVYFKSARFLIGHCFALKTFMICVISNIIMSNVDQFIAVAMFNLEALMSGGLVYGNQ